MNMRFLKTTLMMLALSFLLWGGGFVWFSLNSFTRAADHPDRVDAIVVLTGGSERIEKGLELFSRKISSHLFITGINPKVTRNDILKRSKDTLPKCCITYDTKARTTIENAVETQKWARKQKNPMKNILLVTSDYHINRGALEIQFAMPEVKIYTYPVPHELPWYSEPVMRLLFLEYHKFVYRAVITNLKR